MLINQTQAEASATTTTPTSESAPAASTPAESAPTTTTPVATTAPTTAESAPSTPESKPAESQPSTQTDNALRAQVEALHSELQVWKLRSSMSERHIVPQDFDLVSRLVLESAQSSGKAIDQCVSDLFSSKPYLFKIPKEQTKTVENKSQEVDNKRLIEGAIARLGRAKISL